MENSDIIAFSQFISKELYFFVAFLCGLYLGFIIGTKNND